MINIKDLLLEYPGINKSVLKLNEDLSIVLKAQLNADGCLQCSIISDMPRGSDTTDKTYNATANLFEHLEEISLELAGMAETTKMEIRRLLDIQKNVNYAFLYLTFEEKKIIQLRYFDYPAPKYNWNKVVTESFYERTHCFRLHSQALKKMCKILNMGLNGTKNVG